MHTPSPSSVRKARYAVCSATEARQDQPGYAGGNGDALPDTIRAWLDSSAQVRSALNDLLSRPPSR
jgi:hypothetical protein